MKREPGTAPSDMTTASAVPVTPGQSAEPLHKLHGQVEPDAGRDERVNEPEYVPEMVVRAPA